MLHPRYTHCRCRNSDSVLPQWAGENTVGAPAFMDLGGAQIGGCFAKAIHLADKNMFPFGGSLRWKVEITGGTPRNIT